MYIQFAGKSNVNRFAANITQDSNVDTIANSIEATEDLCQLNLMRDIPYSKNRPTVNLLTWYRIKELQTSLVVSKRPTESLDMNC